MSSVTIKSYRKQREKEITDGIRRGMSRAVNIVRNQAIKNVSKTGSEHPQVQSGDLKGSINARVEEQGNEIIGLVGSRITDPPYPRWLEFGTPGGRQPPYPWLFPAVEMSRGAIIEALKGKFTIT